MPGLELDAFLAVAFTYRVRDLAGAGTLFLHAALHFDDFVDDRHEVRLLPGLQELG